MNLEEKFRRNFSKLFYLIHFNINENNLGKFAVCCKGKIAILVINEGMQNTGCWINWKIINPAMDFILSFVICYLELVGVNEGDGCNESIQTSNPATESTITVIKPRRKCIGAVNLILQGVHL